MKESSPMSTTNEIGTHAAAASAAALNKAVVGSGGVAIGGGGVSISGYFASNDVLAAIGAACAVLGLVLNFYFGWCENRRKQRAHEADEAERAERIRLMREGHL